jgi:hypothetical protein
MMAKPISERGEWLFFFNFFFKDLFNKYNIIMLMQLKVIIFLLKNNNYLLKNYTLNIKCTSLIHM